MANVIQFIATDENTKYFDKAIVNGDLHGFILYPDNRTICGIQMDGDDGYKPSKPIDSKVTCAICVGIIRLIKAQY